MYFRYLTSVHPSSITVDIMEMWERVQDTLLAVMVALVSCFLQVGFSSLFDLHDQIMY